MMKKWVERELMPKYGVAWWKCDEVSGNLIDSKGNYTGTVTNVTRIDDWKGGYALDFNGSNSKITFADKIIPIGAKSIFFRFKRNGIPPITEYFFNSISNGGVQYGISAYIISTGQICFDIYGAGTGVILAFSSVVNVCDNNWHNVLFIWNGTTERDSAKIYVDDMATHKNATTPTKLETNIPTENLTIGCLSTNKYYFKGQLDNIQIYSTAIDPVARFSLIKYDNKIYTLTNNKWIDTGLVEPLTKLDFKEKGITDTSAISKELWDKLGGFEILTWTYNNKYEIKSNNIKLLKDTSYTGNENLFKCDLNDINKINKIEVI